MHHSETQVYKFRRMLHRPTKQMFTKLFPVRELAYRCCQPRQSSIQEHWKPVVHVCIWSSGLMYGSCYKKATDISHEQVQRNAKVRWPNSVPIQLWPTCCNPYWVYNHCLVLPNPEAALCSIPFLLCSTSFCIAHLSHDQRSFCLHPGSPLRQAVTKPKPS